MHGCDVARRGQLLGDSQQSLVTPQQQQPSRHRHRSLKEQVEVESFFRTSGLLGDGYGFYWMGLRIQSQMLQDWPKFTWMTGSERCCRAGLLDRLSACCAGLARPL